MNKCLKGKERKNGDCSRTCLNQSKIHIPKYAKWMKSREKKEQTTNMQSVVEMCKSHTVKNVIVANANAKAKHLHIHVSESKKNATFFPLPLTLSWRSPQNEKKNLFFCDKINLQRYHFLRFFFLQIRKRKEKQKKKINRLRDSFTICLF